MVAAAGSRRWMMNDSAFGPLRKPFKIPAVHVMGRPQGCHRIRVELIVDVKSLLGVEFDREFAIKLS
ncbi:MAG: hypothetical protein ACI9HK_004870 [Pirellulaceae bacterium]|jgi:hypothetical protein